MKAFIIALFILLVIYVSAACGIKSAKNKVKSFAGIIFEIVNLKIVEALCKAYAAGK